MIRLVWETASPSTCPETRNVLSDIMIERINNFWKTLKDIFSFQVISVEDLQDVLTEVGETADRDGDGYVARWEVLLMIKKVWRLYSVKRK